MKTLLVFIIIFSSMVTQPVFANEFGEFIGSVKVEWLDDGRNMKLLEDFSYVDPDNQRWHAPKGSVVDGASIPQVAWSIIGSPFAGKYRTASVLHDVSCDQKKLPWEDVHNALYNAMRAADVSEIKAKTIYGFVYHLGPRWEYSLTKTVSQSEVNTTVNRFKKIYHGNEVKVDVTTKPKSILERISRSPAKSNVQLIVVPMPRTIRENDLDKLQRKIENSNLNLEEIRKYKP